MYASNWPGSERFAPLATVLGIVVEYFRSHGRRAEEKVCSQSAKAACRWVQREKSKQWPESQSETDMATPTRSQGFPR